MMPQQGVIRSGTRLLAVLEALNQREISDLPWLQAEIGLPKATLVRLLRTLVEVGYVRQVSRSAGYALTKKIMNLSAGYRHTDRFGALARGPMDAFTAKHKWPVGLQVYDRGAMRPTYFTGDRSPLNTDPTSLRRQRYPMMTTAHGQVYLTFCTETERETILAWLAASKNPANALARDPTVTAAILAQVGAQGYALKAATPKDRVLGFAVPVRTNGGVAATVGLRYFASAMRQAEAVRRYLVPLTELAATISTSLSELTQPEG